MTPPLSPLSLARRASHASEPPEDGLEDPRHNPPGPSRESPEPESMALISTKDAILASPAYYRSVKMAQFKRSRTRRFFHPYKVWDYGRLT